MGRLRSFRALKYKGLYDALETVHKGDTRGVYTYWGYRVRRNPPGRSSALSLSLHRCVELPRPLSRFLCVACGSTTTGYELL